MATTTMTITNPKVVLDSTTLTDVERTGIIIAICVQYDLDAWVYHKTLDDGTIVPRLVATGAELDFIEEEVNARYGTHANDIYLDDIINCAFADKVNVCPKCNEVTDKERFATWYECSHCHVLVTIDED